MKEDPKEYWDIPEEINSPATDEADVPIVHTRLERIEEEKNAQRYND